jgi:hypothetical protein
MPLTDWFVEGASWGREDSEIAFVGWFRFHKGIQIRADSFIGDRPACPRGCSSRLHRHGCYYRYAKPAGGQRLAVQRYWCPDCGLTLSVLALEQLPYRPLEGPRVEAFFNAQAGIGSGPDPPPGQLEAGCLRRAWTRFQTRVSTLKEAFGLLIPSVIAGAAQLWEQMRLAKPTLAAILGFLAQSRNLSLLGDYRCLRLPN